MREAEASAALQIPAPPGVVYGILADYRVGHPSILPRRVFLSLDVEEGGMGAGTVFRVRMKSFGGTREIHAKVSEPAPGRVLAETDEVLGIRTTFEVRPGEAGQGSHVTIRTRWVARGLFGWIEARLAPAFLRRVYGEELRNLARAARLQAGEKA